MIYYKVSALFYFIGKIFTDNSYNSSSATLFPSFQIFSRS